MDSSGIKSIVRHELGWRPDSHGTLFFSIYYYIFLEFSWRSRIYSSSPWGFIFTLDSAFIKTVLTPTWWELRTWALRSRPSYNKTHTHTNIQSVLFSLTSWEYLIKLFRVPLSLPLLLYHPHLFAYTNVWVFVTIFFISSSYFVFKYIRLTLCCPNALRCGHPHEHGWSTPLKKTGSVSHSYQLPLSSS